VPKLYLEGVPAEISELCGLRIRVTGDLTADDSVMVHCLPIADNNFLYDDFERPVFAEQSTAFSRGFVAVFESGQLARGFRYLVVAYSSSGVQSDFYPSRKLGRKPVCPHFGKGYGYNATMLTFNSVPNGGQVPHNADLVLPGTITPYRAGMTLTGTRYLMTDGVTSNPRPMDVQITGPTNDGQNSTFSATVYNADLDPSKTYFCTVTASIQHYPANVIVTTPA
jgi:hypothetical protein